MWWLWVACAGFSDFTKDPADDGSDSGGADSAGAPSETDEPGDGDTSGIDETGVGGDTGATPSVPPLWLTFQQYVRFGDDFLAKGTHELWIGPDDGSGPPAAGWVRVLDGPAMASDYVPDAWWRRTLDVGPEVAALARPSFAVAFRYAATGADSWYLDEVCVSSTGGTDLLSCDALYADFEGIAVGELPGESRVVRLPGDSQGEDAWGATTNAGPASQGSRSMTIAYSSDPQDQAFILSSYPNGPWP
jgi:hypothetical protein